METTGTYLRKRYEKHVVSLPMRDGNLWPGREVPRRRRVVSLPMRDGNSSSSSRGGGMTPLLAYL